MARRRRWSISLAGLAIAAAPAAAALAAAGPTAATAAAPAVTAVSAHTAAGHITITHGPAVRNGGVRVAVPGGKALSRHSKNASATSTNWSGYAATGSTYNSVSASWVQPSVTCGSTATYSSFWVGLDGYSSNSVEQTGTDSDCSGGKPQYYGWYEMYPHPSYSFGSTVSAGDTMSASVTFSGTNSYTLTLSDKTKGWSTSTTKKLNGAARSSAEVIIEAPYSGGILPLADFGTVNFTNSLVNGAAIGNYNPTSIDMVNSSGAYKDTVSSLTNGENFSATWDRSN